ncbi:type II toxin-antitoxin system HicA family toxin [Brachybacterium sp. GCM10030267]|uniref:type II toxin-antitoxin system HicA family toxin n=1 Tax=Brachybacterium sp. GCM10030267 TaxID=3273381 RepID=UPI00361413CA
MGQKKRPPRPTPPTPKPPTPKAPTPKALRGLKDPARTVRPVDYTATGRRDPEPRRDPAPRRAPEPRRRSRTIEPPRQAPTPPDAVHTLRAEDPRPLPRPLRIAEEDIRSVGIRDITTERIVHVVADPEDAWTADAGTSDHFLRGDLVVQVRRADNAVIGVFSARYALSVRPEDYEPALDIAEEAAGPGARGGKGTRHPTTRRELLRRMEAAGFVVTPGAGHGRVSHPDHPGLFVPFASTPSDRRFTRHAVAQIRRVFGIDLRR